MLSSTHEHRDYLRHAKFPQPVERAAVEEEWRRQGFTLEEFNEGPGGELRSMGQSKDELLVVVRGSVDCEVGLPAPVARLLRGQGVSCQWLLQVDGRLSKLQPGDELYIPLNTQYTARNAGDTYAHIYIGYA